MEIALNGNQILDLLDHKANLVQYREVENYRTIEQLLGPHKKCVLLYHTSEDFGHWVCLYQVGKTIYFFDSYGVMIDDQLKFLPKNLREDMNSSHRYLTNLLYRSKKMIEYNQHELQKHSPLIQTCGRWCVNRLRYPDISIDDYYKMFKDASSEMPMDELIVELVPIN